MAWHGTARQHGTGHHPMTAATQLQLFTHEKVQPHSTTIRDLADLLGPLAAQHTNRDGTIRAELALLARMWPRNPVRAQIISYVVHTMGGRGWTDICAAQLGRELGRNPSTVRSHLADAYAQGVLAQRQYRERRHTVRRVITRGIVLTAQRDFVQSRVDDFVQSRVDEPVQSRVDTPISASQEEDAPPPGSHPLGTCKTCGDPTEIGPRGTHWETCWPCHTGQPQAVEEDDSTLLQRIYGPALQ